jgi:predicted site-specific integrase-resolvase
VATKRRPRRTNGKGSGGALVPLKDVCLELGIHANTGYRWRDGGEFPLEVIHLGGRYYCHRTDVDAYLHRAPAAS